MDIILNFLIVIFLSISLVELYRLCYIVKHTENITDFLCVCDWFGKYTKISQRIRSKSVVEEIRKKYRDMPIREQIAEYGRIFESDFNKLFDKLKPHVRYRVTTHYSDVVNKAAADGKIRLLEEPRFEKKRTLTEMKPLLGRRDYILAKRCIRHYPQLIRCCENCARKTKCACSRGGVCAVSFEKMFFTFVFKKLDAQD